MQLTLTPPLGATQALRIQDLTCTAAVSESVELLCSSMRVVALLPLGWMNLTSEPNALQSKARRQHTQAADHIIPTPSCRKGRL